MTKSKKIGLALGGGGVCGLAHVPVLETLDTCGLVPAAIAGTSMGAIMGALYASGKSGKEIRQMIEEHRITRGEGLKKVYAKKRGLFKWFSAVRIAWNSSGLLNADGLILYLLEQMDATCFEDLKLPLQVLATDFYSGEPVVFNSGPLRPAILASMSIPGVFVPVEHEGRILIDGGLCNNLPYDLLQENCETVIAIDVTPERKKRDPEPPNMIEATMGMFGILVDSMTLTKVRENPPTLYFHPRILDVRILEFNKSEDVLKQAEAALPAFKTQLERTTLSLAGCITGK